MATPKNKVATTSFDGGGGVVIDKSPPPEFALDLAPTFAQGSVSGGLKRKFGSAGKKGPGQAGDMDYLCPGDAGRMLSRNVNGTIAMTSHPTNESELQLYRVLQRANLLSYYDTFICQGGDDVQQLCEAGEEEFLEIMALVNMATKPLHVRRLQKALQEWVNNPSMFLNPLVPHTGATTGNSTPFGPTALSPSRAGPSPGPLRPSPPVVSASTSPTPLGNKDAPSPGPSASSSQGAGEDYGQPGSPLALTPVLMESQICRLAEAAEMLVRALPANFEPKFPASKRKISKDLEYVMNMHDDDPRRMDEIRKYAAIYGRFDCKRKPEKPLTLHEVSVNEAAAQICKHLPALLTRRDELFPLARQVVRESGYPYSKGHSRSQIYGGEDPACKRLRYDAGGVLENRMYLEEERKKKQERLEGVAEQLKNLALQAEELKVRLAQAIEAQNGPVYAQLQVQLDAVGSQHLQLIGEQSELAKQLRKLDRYFSGKSSVGSRASCSETEKVDTDDTDSQFSIYSNASSPTPSHDAHDSPSQDSSDAFGKSGKKLTKQLVQETLMDEGLRVVKEYSNQIKEEPPTPPPMVMAPQPGSRPRGRPPRLDKDREYLSAYVKSPPPPKPPHLLQNGHSEMERNSNGLLTKHDAVEDLSDKANSLNALLALSQKGIKQESPNSTTSMN